MQKQDKNLNECTFIVYNTYVCVCVWASIYLWLHHGIIMGGGLCHIIMKTLCAHPDIYYIHEDTMCSFPRILI